MTVYAISFCNVQESSEEKRKQLKERLSCLFEVNERRCSRRVLYGSDLLQACTLSTEPGHSALTAGGWRWVGRESCLRAQRTCVATTSALQSALLSVEDRMESATNLIKRYVHVLFQTIIKYLINPCAVVTCCLCTRHKTFYAVLKISSTTL